MTDRRFPPPWSIEETARKNEAASFEAGSWDSGRRENKPLASENSPEQGQHDETANGDVIGNEHGIPTAQIAPRHVLTLGRRLF
jgi:hypothetical protein